MDWKFRLAMWLLKRSRYHAHVLAVDKALLAAAFFAVKEAQRARPDDSGEAKRSQALQVLSNQMSAASHHDCANAIQLALSLGALKSV